MPTNASDAEQTLRAAAKAAIIARALAPAMAEALVATARGEADEGHEASSSRIREAHRALSRILAWVRELPFDADDLSKIRAAIEARELLVHDDNRTEQLIREGTSEMRALGLAGLSGGW